MKLASSAGRCRGISSSSNSNCYRPPLPSTTPCALGLPTSRASYPYHRNNAYSRRLLARLAARKGSYDSMNPDLDAIQLDDAYYEEIGMTREQALRQQKEMLYDIDPDAVLLDDIAKVDESLPEEWRTAIESLEVYGPKALLMAGFRAEEYAVARATLDQLGADQIKILPVTQDMLQGPLDMALSTPEIDWSAPRPPDWILGGAWGSQRCIMFSGLSVKAQATILEYLEAQGVPHVCVTMALKEDGRKRLGELMAAAVQAQRNMKAPKIAPWEVSRQAGSSAAAATPSSSSSSSSSTVSTKRGINLSSLPGKRGPLFTRRPAAAAAAGRGSSSSSSSGRLNDEGLEDLQDLITPELAKQRLKIDAGDISKELTGVIDMELTEEDDLTPPPSLPQQQQQQADSGSSSSSGAYKGPGIDQDPEAMLDWFLDESTGKTIELPWVDDQPAAAAAAAAAAGLGADTSSSRAPDLGAEFSLDDLLPPRDRVATARPPATAAAAAQPGSSSSGADPIAAAAASRVLDPSESDGVSVFSAIQSALRSGVDPEQLKQLIDAAAAASAAARDPVDLLLNDDSAMQQKAQQTADALKTSSISSSNNSSKLSGSDATRPAAAAAAAESRAPVQECGPQPPPPGAEFGGSQQPGVFDSDPLLKLRPEIERAFQNNQIKFVDMNKMPRKYKQQYTQEALQQRTQQRQQSYFQQQQQQQQEEEEEQVAQPSSSSISKQQRQRWWQQQRSRQQQQLLQGLKSGPIGSGSVTTGGKIVEMDVAGGSPDLPQQQQQQQQQQSSSYSGEEIKQRGAYMQSAAAAAAAAAADMADDTAGSGSSSNTTDVAEDDQFDDAIFANAELVGEFEEDPLESLRFSKSQLQDLVDSARSENLDPTRALAQAIAFGVQVDPEVAEAVGVDLPSQDLIESARKDIVGSIREMQQDQALGEDSTVIMGEEGYQGIAADKVKDQGSGDIVSDLSDLPDLNNAEVAAVPAGALDTSTGSGRVWGSGLSSAVSRAKARLAAKKQQQQ